MGVENGDSFPAQARLRRRDEFGHLLKRQQKAVGKHVVLLIGPSRAGRPRLGVMISRKVSKSSPRRHQLKRWSVELFRRELQHAMPKVDLLVLFRRDPPRQGHDLLDREIRSLIDAALQAKAQWRRRRR